MEKISDKNLKKTERNIIINMNQVHDPLTKVYSRSFFEKQLELLPDEDLPASIIVCDINGLGRINRSFGVEKGDAVLGKVAEVLQAASRKEDLIARWGEDEFALLLPNTSCSEAEVLADWIKENVQNMTSVRISIGIAVADEKRQDLKEVLAEAETSMLQAKLFAKDSVHSSILSSLQKVLEEVAFETEQHSERIHCLSARLGRAIGLSRTDLSRLHLLALLHDLGKVAVPREILLKPTVLTEKEFAIIRQHPEIGARIVRTIPQLVSIGEEILSHHERWDGKGYPRGLKGEEIPLLARIVSIADAFDVMTQGRVYRTAMDTRAALWELKKCAGSQFDPQLVEIFISFFEKNSLDRLS